MSLTTVRNIQDKAQSKRFRQSCLRPRRSWPNRK